MTKKTTEHRGSVDATGEYTPWTEKLRGWQKHTEIPGDILPKRLLRPYWFEPPVRIDDKQYVCLNITDRKSALGMVYGFAYIIAAGAALGWVVTGFSETTALLVTLICLAIALPIHSYAQKLEYDRFCIFDREKGVFISERGWFKKKTLEVPFYECEGRLHRQAHVFMVHFALYLDHPDVIGGIPLISTSTLDEPLGYWSFLLQYMDKNKPLPDIPLLKDYPDREPGLGSPEEWKKLEKQPDFIEPFALWLAELEQHPEWDKANYGRELKSDWWQQVIFALVVLAITVLIAYVMIILTT